MIDIKINNVSVNYKVGFNIEEHLNETLDSGLLVVPQIEKQAYEPMDEVVVSGDYSKYMLISNIKATLSHFQDTALYNYELSLISPTIKLQRIVLPNRSVTQPIVGELKTIYQVLSQYVEIYAPDFTLSQALIDKTSSVTCPEWQWNIPTLFEVFNDLLSAVDCVVTMTDFTTISVLDLNKQGEAVDMQLVNNIEYNYSIEGYASDMVIEAKNVANKVKNATMYDVVVPKSDEAIVTVANARFMLAKPIFEINKATIMWRRKNPLNNPNLYPEATVFTDITDHIVERAVYDTYKVSNTLDIVNSPDYKRNALYYVEGDNSIYGLGYTESNWLPIDPLPALINIIADVMGYPYQDMLNYTTNKNDILEMGLIIQYTTIEDVKFASFKERQTKHQSTLINNQNTTYVDIGALSISQQQNINRIGNEEMQIYGRSEDISALPDTADYIDEYKVTGRIISFHNEWYEFTCKLAKDYVIKEMFTGLNSKRRYLQFAQQADAFFSNHLTVNRYKFTNEQQDLDNMMSDYFMQIGKKDMFPKIVVVRTMNDFISAITVVGVAGSTSIIEKGIIYNFAFNDNINAGYSVVKKAELLGDALKVNNTPYVDEKGEYKYLEYRLFKDIENPDFADDVYLGGEEALERARNYPVIDEKFLDFDDIIYDSDNLLRHKDNREITSETLQFHFDSEDNIFVGRKFFEYNPLYYKENADKELKIIVSPASSGLYTKYDTKGKAGVEYTNVVIENNNIYLGITNAEWDAIPWIASWAVVDSDDNIILANNGRQRKIYLVGGIPFTRKYISVAVTQSNKIDVDAIRSTNYEVGVNLTQQHTISIKNDQSINYQTSIALTQEHNVSVATVAWYSTHHDVSIAVTQESNVDVVTVPSIDYLASISLQQNHSVSLSVAVDKPVWVTTPSTAYDATVSLNTGSMNATAVTMMLTTNYPPAKYNLGWVMRVRVYSFDGSTLLGTTYRERGNNA